MEQVKMDRHKIFVYGTLRSGGGNNPMLRESKLVAIGKTEQKYALYVQGIPYAVKDEAICSIVGEVWSIDSSTLQMIDVLEGHPIWYKRELISVVTTDNKIVMAWMYFNSSPKGVLRESGDYFNP